MIGRLKIAALPMGGFDCSAPSLFFPAAAPLPHQRRPYFLASSLETSGWLCILAS
jgi:hypothetical protein